MNLIEYSMEMDEDKIPQLKKEKENPIVCKSLNTPSDIANMLDDLLNLSRKSEEYVYILAVNVKKIPIGLFEVTHGTNNMSILSAREIYMRALACGAAKIILVHNHPSGDTHPSSDDIKSTESIESAGKMIGIPLLDHIIIGDDYFSFKESHYL